MLFNKRQALTVIDQLQYTCDITMVGVTNTCVSGSIRCHLLNEKSKTGTYISLLLWVWQWDTNQAANLVFPAAKFLVALPEGVLGSNAPYLGNERKLAFGKMEINLPLACISKVLAFQSNEGMEVRFNRTKVSHTQIYIYLFILAIDL